MDQSFDNSKGSPDCSIRGLQLTSDNYRAPNSICMTRVAWMRQVARVRRPLSVSRLRLGFPHVLWDKGRADATFSRQVFVQLDLTALKIGLELLHDGPIRSPQVQRGNRVGRLTGRRKHMAYKSRDVAETRNALLAETRQFAGFVGARARATGPGQRGVISEEGRWLIRSRFPG
ncbi:hypothetical protein E4U43_000060 [Claviceps pusilla]|uniref:Uncharacterized protein n=1 Tax=Claviceps pusilla TaxID=123648 RepID=A0A9P7SXZ9_9HYPO|nr:hypothetical protein E4U43_000060 [Claviceps pusilla]